MTWGSREWFGKNLIESQNGSASGYYSHSLNGYQKQRHAKIAKLLSGPQSTEQSLRVLDIGCGLGDLGRLVGKMLNAEVIGIDFIPELIQVAKQLQPSQQFAVCSLPDLAFEKESFDLVIASEVLYYLTNKSRSIAIKNIAQSLKLGGKIVFTSVIDDGSRYFSEMEAVHLFDSYFYISKVDFDHHIVYRGIQRLAILTIRANSFIQSSGDNSITSLEYLSLPWKVINYLKRFGWFSLLASRVSSISERILLSENLPNYLNSMCKILLGKKARTNINIMAVRL